MIEYEAFIEWVQERFPVYREERGEVKINSIFIEDNKCHLWCNTKKNAYHCWKSGKSGNLIKLVSEIDDISPEDAARLIGVDNPLRYYDSRIEELFREKKVVIPPKPQVELPPNTFLISSLSDISPSKRVAEQYLSARKIPLKDMLVCTSGKYKERIIIPYKNREGALIYWNGRSLRSEPRYLGPEREVVKVGKEDVIYFYRWPKNKECVYLTEGEFDAISLVLSGLLGGACGGKILFDKQMEYLNGHPICLSFDNDERGLDALHTVGTRLLREGRNNLTFIRPPTLYKDWNQMLVERGPQVIGAYIKRYQKPYDQWTQVYR